jgi:hypothetical protein
VDIEFVTGETDVAPVVGDCVDWAVVGGGERVEGPVVGGRVDWGDTDVWGRVDWGGGVD